MVRRRHVGMMVILALVGASVSACGIPEQPEARAPTQTPWVVTATPQPPDLPPAEPQPTDTASVESTPTDEPGSPGETQVLVDLHVRSGPGVDYPSLGVVPAHDRLYVFGRAEAKSWVKVITAAELLGWVNAAPQYVALAAPLESYPLIAPPEAPTVTLVPTSAPTPLDPVEPTATQDVTPTASPSLVPTEAPTPAPAPTEAPTLPPEPPTATALPPTPTTELESIVLATQLDIRTGPGEAYPAWTYLPGGTVLTGVVGRAEGLPWVKIAFTDGAYGWASADPSAMSLVPTLDTYPIMPYHPVPGCDPAYPTICLWYGSPDLDCPQINAGNFLVLPPDPHGLDRDGDRRGCEWN